VYVFENNEGSWLEQAVLIGSDVSAWDSFGASIAIDGNVAVVGAPHQYDLVPGPGAAYVFRFDRSGWVEEGKLTAGNGENDDGFGCRVGVSGDFVVVGAHRDDDFGPGFGSAYVFRWVSDEWVQYDKLGASDGEGGAQFGSAVAVSRDALIVGAYRDDAVATDSGAAYVYRLIGDQWLEAVKLIPHDAHYSDRFGISATILEGNVAYIAARNYSGHSVFGGAMYAYSIASHDCHSDGVPDECQSNDINGDDAVDLDDFDLLLGCLTGPGSPLRAGSCCHIADVDGEWDVDLSDLAAFQRVFTGP
jgi:hypothetical protein